MPEKKVIRQQMNFFQRAWDSIVSFVRETMGELRKVSWPTRKETINLTGIVLLVIAVMALVLGLLDVLYSMLFDLFI